MAIPSSGAVSFSTIQTEFGGSNPISLSEYYAGGSYVPAGTSGTNGAVPSSGAISVNKFYGTTKTVSGQQAYTTPGTYTWLCPAGVTSVSVVAVGGGGYSLYTSGGGGGLGYKNNYTVVPGTSYLVVVGDVNQDSWFSSTGVVKGGGGSDSTGGTYTGDGGGNGGAKGSYGGMAGGGGGAGGYSGNGGNGGNPGASSVTAGSNGAGGGGGGGGGGKYVITASVLYGSGGGGGVGILGQGSNGAGGAAGTGSSFPSAQGGGGGGGSGGANANGGLGTGGGSAGLYGGGGGGQGHSTETICCEPQQVDGNTGQGKGGAVRIIWPGNTRAFPSTNTGDV